MKDLLLERGALLEGHFLLSSGLHSNQYVQCARLFEDPALGERLGRELAKIAPEPADVVVSPALGGILIGYDAARALRVPFLFTERADGQMVLRRGFVIKPKQRALIVEDVFTTGKSTREVARIILDCGAVLAGAASIINRGVTSESLGMPCASLLNLPLAAYPPDRCPLCAAGKPIVKPGSRPQPMSGAKPS